MPLICSSSTLDACPPAAATDATPQNIGRRRRVRTGCITCRVRRVKCDETRPHCTRCTSTGRKCDGYEASSVSRNELSRALRKGEPMTAIHFGSNTFTNAEERQIFEFFREKTVSAGAGNIIGWGFWDRTVLQFVHSEPAIKHAVLALSTLHRAFAKGHAGYVPTGKPYFDDDIAIRHYGHAIHNARKLFEAKEDDPSSVEKVLTACVLFISVEHLLSNSQAAQMHLLNGMRIEREANARAGRSKKQAGKGTGMQSIVSQALARMDFTAMTMSTTESAYPWTNNGNCFDHSEVVPSRFATLGEAERYMFSMLRDLFAFSSTLGRAKNAFEMLAKISTASSWFSQQLGRWNAAFEPLASNLEKLDSVTKSRCVILRVYQKVAILVSEAGHTASELAYDYYDKEIEEILDLIETSPAYNTVEGNYHGSVFSLESGIVVPLFYIAGRCRHPRLRRRAIHLLRKQRRREVIWESIGAASVAEWWIAIEEAGMHPKLPNGRPSDKDRIRLISADVRIRDSVAAVKAFMPSDKGTNSLRTVEDIIPLCLGIGDAKKCVCQAFPQKLSKLGTTIVKDKEYLKVRYEGVHFPPPNPDIEPSSLMIASNNFPQNADGPGIDLARAAAHVGRGSDGSASPPGSPKIVYKPDNFLLWEEDGFFHVGKEQEYYNAEADTVLTPEFTEIESPPAQLKPDFISLQWI